MVNYNIYIYIFMCNKKNKKGCREMGSLFRI